MFALSVKTHDPIFEQEVFLLECAFLDAVNNRMCFQVFVHAMHTFEMG